MRYAGLLLVQLFLSEIVVVKADDDSILDRPEGNPAPPSQIQWHDDYHAGLDAAEHKGKLAFIWFFDPTSPNENQQFENEVLNRPDVRLLLDTHHVAIKFPTTATILSGGESVVLLDHPSFAEMLHRPGLAIVDMTAA